MKACIVHHSLNACGGAERVAFRVADILEGMGFRVKFLTFEPTDWGRIKSIWPHVRVRESKSLFPFKVKTFGIYMRMLTSLVAVVGRECDLIVNTHGDVMLSPAHIAYVHFPTFVGDRYVVKYRSGFWRAYYEPFRYVVGKFNAVRKSTVVLTNSTFSRRVLREVVGRDALVVHPPVDVGKFMDDPPDGREDAVAVVGRFSPEKRFEAAIRAVSKTPYKLYLVGTCYGPISRRYLDMLKSLADEVMPGRAEFLVNVPDSKVVEVLTSVKAYLHVMRYEHFGIAVVEAMAAGAVPVIHASGGPFEDITERGRYGVPYVRVGEIPSAVEKAIKVQPELEEKLRRRAKLFRAEVFDARVKRVIVAVSSASRPRTS